MRHRNTVVLLILFLTGIVVLWWADYTDLPTRERQQELSNRLLPELIDTPLTDIRRVEIDRRSGPLKDRVRLARLDGRWQLLEPFDTAADPDLAETLIRNLKELPKSAVAGSIVGDPVQYGLKEPDAVVKLFVEGKTEPLATLALGKVSKDMAFVRPGVKSAIEVASPRALSPLSLPATRWRDTALFRIPSFRVKSVTIREAKPERVVEIERDDRRWRLVSPIQVPADNDKAEGLVAELSALRILEGDGGFVADNINVRDRAAYGLDTPSTTITVSPFDNSGQPQTLLLGKAVPGKPDEYYAMRADQDDVVRLDLKRLREAFPSVNGLRSQTVLDLNPGRIDRLRIDARGTKFDLVKTQGGWKLLSPVIDAADNAAVQTLLSRLAELKASEFLDASRVPSPNLDTPSIRIRGWQPGPGVASSSPSATEEPKDAARFDLALGRLDKTRNTVYGRIAGDPTVLALPDSILKELPRNAFAYRDRAVLAIEPPQFASITVERERSTVTVEAPPRTGATGTRWKLVQPVAAPADEAAVTNLLLTLGGLHAETWESDRVGDGKAFGLDAPWLRVKWTLQPNTDSVASRHGVLRLGKLKPEEHSIYANLEGDERVFTLNSRAVASLDAELHTQKVMGFKADDAQRVVLRWPSRTISLEKGVRHAGAAAPWEVTAGYDTTGFEVARIGPIVAALADLSSPRFLQYTGPLPEASGLANPRVTVSVTLAGKAEELILRVGRSLNATTFEATNVAGDSGPVFVLTAGPWADVLKPPIRPGELPEDVFVPEPPPAKPGAGLPGFPPGFPQGIPR